MFSLLAMDTTYLAHDNHSQPELHVHIVKKKWVMKPMVVQESNVWKQIP